MVKFSGFYNFGGAGTETITGGANENIPSFEENVCSNDKMFISGQFSNLSRELIHVTLKGFSSAETWHKHDLRAYESINVKMIPVKSIGIHVPTGKTIGFHGMGSLWQIEDEDEYAVFSANSELSEALRQSPDFMTDEYKDTQITTATTTTLWTPASSTAIGLYKITCSASGAQTVKFFWTDSVGGNIYNIGLVRFSAEGTWVYDFDTAMMRNPNGNDGLLKCTTTTTATTDVTCIGHDIKASQ